MAKQQLAALKSYITSMGTLTDQEGSLIGEVLKSDVVRNINKELDPDGRNWVPLHPITKQRRRDRGQSDIGILKVTNTLRGSIEKHFEKIGSRTSIIVGSPVKYARLQNDGGKTVIEGREVIVPARPYMFFTEKALDVVNKLFLKKIDSKRGRMR